MEYDGLFTVTPLFMANYETTERTIVNQGGTSSGKTYCIMQILFIMGIERAGRVITVVGQDIPNLKRGAYRDAKTILASSDKLRKAYPDINESDRVIKCTNGSIIEFTSYKDAQDAKNGKRDVLFLNEANGIPYEIFWQLDMRTREKVFLDYNPSARFWVHEQVIGREGVRMIISDHRMNPFLSQQEHDKIEHIDDDELWKVYARGKTGRIMGLVYNNWDIVDELPAGDSWKMSAYGLDWGFVNDDTALVHVVLAHGDLWLDELIYETGLLNTQIAERAKVAGLTERETIIADNAEMKSIAELNGMGLHVLPCVKGAGSVLNGIDIVRRYRLHITRRSVGLRKEAQNYKWKTDKNGEPTNEPVDSFNHGLDAVRYVCMKYLNIHKEVRGIKRTN
jgi:phage terminase large subunit